MVPDLDDQGTVVRPALDQKTAYEYASGAFKEAAGDPNRRDQFKAFLSGATDEMPEAWVRQQEVSPSAATVRRSAMADAAARGRKEHPVQAALYDYVVDPLGRATGAMVDIPVNIGIGALNLAPGVDINPIDTRKAAATLFQFIGNEDKTTWGEASQQIEEQTRAMDDTKGFLGKSAAFAGGLTGTLAGLRSKIAQTVFKPGAALGQGAVSLGFKAVGKEAGARALGYGAAAGSFAGYDALIARGADGGKASLADRGEAAMYGALAGTIVQGSSEVAKAAFKSILKRGLGDLGPAEKESLNGIKKWALDNKVAPVPRESQQAYMNRVVDTWIDAGAPGLTSKGRQLAAYVAKGTTEGVGFMGLDAMDAHFRSQLFDAVFEGDQDAIIEVMAKMAGNSFAMTAHHMPLREIAGWQRQQPTRVEPTYQMGRSGMAPEIGPDQVRNVGEQQADAASVKAQRDLQGKVEADRKSVADQRAYEQAAKTASPVNADYSSPKGPNPARDPATGTYLQGNLERLGWQQEPSKSTVTGFDPSVSEASKKQFEVPPEEQKTSWQLPGTNLGYEVTGDIAKPSPELRSALSLPEQMPVQKLQEAVESASLMSSLQAKALLPGEEISADGMKAEVIGEDAKVRAIRMGEVVEAELAPDMQWKPAESFPARGKDPIDKVQSGAVDALTEVLNMRADMRGRDRALLSSVIEVLDTVAASRDKAVADMVHHLPDALNGLHSASPEHAGKIVKALAEMLTTKSPEVALDDLVATMKRAEDAKANPEAGFLDVGGAAKGTAELLSGAYEGGREVGKSVYDSFIRDQMTSLSKRSGDRSLEDSMREANTRGAENQAEAMGRFKPAEEPLRKNLKRYMEEVQTPMGMKPRWTALAEDLIQPETPADATVGQSIKEALLTLHRQGREAGSLIRVGNPETGQSSIENLREAKSAKMPYHYGEDFGKVMGDAKLQRAWFDHVAEQNPRTITVVDPATNRRVTRARTGEDLVAEYKAESGTTKITGTERTAAYEHFRKFPVMDATWNGFKILETNPFEAVDSVIRQQSGRAGVEKVFGPDLAASVPEADRARLGVTEDKLGGEKAIMDWMEKVNAPTQEKAELLKNASDVMVRLQGGEPVKTPQALKTYRRVIGVRRAVAVMMSGLQDIPAGLIDPFVFTGSFRQGLKSILGAVSGYRDARQQAEVAGSLMHKVGNFDLMEATDPLSKLTDLVSWFGTKTERAKTVIFDKTAQVLLENWTRGIINSQDRQLVEKVLDFNPEQAAKLLSGQAGRTLQNQFRQEFVFHAASRGRAVNRSRMVSNPYFNSLVAFSNWATKRLYGLAKEAKSMSILWERDSTAQERMGALKLATKRATGLVLGGMAGQALMYLWQDLFKGKNGLFRYWKELMSNPGATVAKGSIGGVLGGPLGTIWNAATSRPEAVTNLVEPVGFLYQMLNTASHGATPKAQAEVAYDTLTNVLGAGQIGRNLKDGITFAGAAWAGTADHLRDESDLYSWTRSAGIQMVQAPSKERSEALYGALRSIKHDLYRQTATGEDAGKVTYAAMEDKLTKALGLESGKNLAAAIRGMRTLDILPNDEDRVRYAEHAGPEQYKRMVEHDQMIDDLARLVGKQHGTASTAFEDELSMAAKVAMQGDRNAWNSLAERAVDDAAQMLKLKQPVGDEIKLLAERMASHPQSIAMDSTFSGKGLEMLTRPGIKFDRQRTLIERLLLERARDKVERDRRDELAEKRKESRKAAK